MSGLEVAGLVLGAFPLLISAMEHGRSMAKVGRLHRRMREEYNNCRSDVKFYQVWYDRNLDALLRTVVSDSGDLKRLLANPGGELWQSGELQRALEDRLQDSYSVYANIMARMNEAVNKLKAELGVDNANIQTQLVVTESTTVVAASRSTSSLSTTFSRLSVAKSRWDYETFRVKFSLNEPSRKDLFSQLKECNERLEKLFTMSERAPPPDDTRAALDKQISTLQTVFKHVRTKSNSLYHAVYDSWKCPCQGHHYANLRLEHRTARIGMTFQMALDYDHPSTRRGPWSWQEVRCKQLTEGCPCLRHTPASPLALAAPAPILRADSDSAAVIKAKKKKVAIRAPESSVTELQTMTPPAMHLCNRLAGCNEDDMCLGVVSHDGEAYHLAPLGGGKDPSVTLDEVLSGAQKLSRRLRCLIALLLASSIAQLESTPWLSTDLRKSDVLFYPRSEHKTSRGQQEDCFKEPYIRTGFAQTAVDEQSPRTKSRLELLGILLLELCFGERLEDQPAGRLHASFPEEERQVLDLVVAQIWSKKVNDEAGSEYFNAVHWCLTGGAKYGQGNDAWRSDMIKNVVAPLEKCQDHFRAVAAC